MELKNYQQKAIDTLRWYLIELEEAGPKHAFIYSTNQPYNDTYFRDTPFVCVKIPTGGGKTLVGCYALNAIMGSVLRHKMEKGIVMWFVPSEAIKTQTLKKFKDRNDIHRQVLDENFQNNVRILSNEEALHIRKEDVDDNLCIIISSLEAFRKDRKIQAKYKVYQENGGLIEHFENIQLNDSLEHDDHGTVINSLANVIRLNNPLIVIDEGHKTKTKLSIDFLSELNPSFIIEYTATPREGSNILVDIGASDLKEEEMVKIPIVLESSNQWLNSLERGIHKRDFLENESKKAKNEYIRPIALIQAQPKSNTTKTITVEQVKEQLLAAKISEEEIAIKTSDRNDLEGVNLYSKQCKIRYIITVSALAEGWDCSFAYVLISLANVGAKIAVEQVIGRIIRMPNAKKKTNEELNRCYIFASAKNFTEAAGQIISGLESNGYSKHDMVDATQQSQQYELEVTRTTANEFRAPMMSLGADKLSFEDLIREDFKLSNQETQFDFKIHHDSDGRAIIDIQKGDKWIQGAQQMLNLTYSDKNFSRAELIKWLDKKLRFILLDQEDKIAYLRKVIDFQLKKKSLAELSVNRYVFLEKISSMIDEILRKHAFKNFEYLLSSKKISVKTYESFPEKIIIGNEVPQSFNKNYYYKIDKLNKEELSFVQRLDLDGLPNVEFWIRNREKKDPFYIQGWQKNKFYPDFIAVTKKGNIIALEWKGEDRVTNEDTEYKVEIGRLWAKLGGGKLHFYLVHNKNIEDVLVDLKKL